MAVGDVTTVITANMAQGDTTDRQPASGVEELFLAYADVDHAGAYPNAGPQGDPLLIDETNNQAIYFDNQTTSLASVIMYAGKFMADNTNYFRFLHAGATTGDYGSAVIVVG